MSTNAFRLPLNIQGKAEPEVVEAMQWHDDAINDLQQAIPVLKSQIAASQKTVTTPGGTTNVTSSSQTVIVQTSTTGVVNNQIGSTAYTTQASDNGALIVFNDSSAIAVTLATGTGIQTPWFCYISNMSAALGSGTITFTPATGLVNGAASLDLPPQSWATIFYDGTNFYVLGSS